MGKERCKGCCAGSIKRLKIIDGSWFQESSACKVFVVQGKLSQALLKMVNSHPVMFTGPSSVRLFVNYYAEFSNQNPIETPNQVGTLDPNKLGLYYSRKEVSYQVKEAAQLSGVVSKPHITMTKRNSEITNRKWLPNIVDLERWQVILYWHPGSSLRK